MLGPRLRLCASRMHRALKSRSAYNWGSYDASSGECCKMRDKEITACTAGKMGCPMSEIRNKCCGKSTESRMEDEYAQHLLKIIRRGKSDEECNLIQHDMKLYKPSDKNRRFQRTWAECPLIWLRPKTTCCPNPEYYPPMKRRIRKPNDTVLTPIEQHLFQMSLICKAFLKAPGCKPGRQPPRCFVIRHGGNCQKKQAPFPSFSEACRDLVPNYCSTDCICGSAASMCDAWNAFHKRGKHHKPCIRPKIGFSPFRNRNRFPF